MPARRTLSQQLLSWQLLIIAVLLASVAAYSLAQSNAAFRATEGRRMLSAAEDLAATRGVRTALVNPFQRDALPTFAESVRGLSGADEVLIANAGGIVLTASDPTLLGSRLPADGAVRSGRAWVGEVTSADTELLTARVPVIGEDTRVIGFASAGTRTPNFFQGVAAAPQQPLALLAFATVLGVLGSVLLARRVKRLTLGLEPAEITRLVEHREALLHGIREGVLGVDEHHRITLVNAQARALLALPEDCVGTPIDSLDLNERARDVLCGRTTGADQVIAHGDRVVVLNRVPIRQVGAVVTMRDRTELVDLRRELDANRQATDTLRAQAHEFSNRLHTISGLIELGEHEEVRHYVERISHSRDQWFQQVSGRVDDPAIAALLVAKASLAAERDTCLRLHPDSDLPRLDDALSADVVTVLGNLIDNALDAVEHRADTWVEARLHHDGTAVTVTVSDSGPGVAPELFEAVFQHGFSTKSARGEQRGLGLALTEQLCRARGGGIGVRNEAGAVFEARIPLHAVERPAAAGAGQRGAR